MKMILTEHLVLCQPQLSTFQLVLLKILFFEGGILASQNGPSNADGKIGQIIPATSTPSIASVDSTTNTTPEKKKKSKKKKLLGLFKSS